MGSQLVNMAMPFDPNFEFNAPKVSHMFFCSMFCVFLHDHHPFVQHYSELTLCWVVGPRGDMASQFSAPANRSKHDYVAKSRSVAVILFSCCV